MGILHRVECCMLDVVSKFLNIILSLDLSVSSSSWGLGRAAVCDCDTP